MPEKGLAVKYRFSPKPNSSRNYCMAIGKSAARTLRLRQRIAGTSPFILLSFSFPPAGVKPNP
jgi:hypothetical protein